MDWATVLTYAGAMAYTIGPKTFSVLRGSGQQASRVRQEHEFRADMNKDSNQRIEKAEGGQHHTESVDEQGTREVLHDDTLAAPSDS